MNYNTELSFIQKILEQYSLKTHIIPESESHYSYVDKGIRQLIGFENLYEETADIMKKKLSSNTVYIISDEFLSNYFLLKLPGEAEISHLVIGPFTTKSLTQSNLLSLMKKHNISNYYHDGLLQYYSSIPLISDITPIRILLSTFSETVWHTEENCNFEEIHYTLSERYQNLLETPIYETPQEARDISFEMQILEERYQAEGKLIKYVSQGNYDKASTLLSGFNTSMIENRSNTPLRDFKNYTIILNTLLRKGAEVGDVHPLHIDKLSSHYARKIEYLTSMEQGLKLVMEMIRKYCLLVKNHSLKNYSLLVQKTVTRIDADLTIDQSLKTHAQLLSVHPSYLSSLFHKETGMTLTEYVNQKRIEHGIFLLNTTNMPIQLVAQQCGIPDINYFTRTFKKHVGKTPTEYKRTLYE